MKKLFVCALFLSFIFLFTSKTYAIGKLQQDLPFAVSEQTQVCILCHKNVTPGIVEDWKASRHSKITPEIAIKKPVLERRVSSEIIPADKSSVVVGCYECHSQNSHLHKDNFEHFGFQINVVVSPNDCKTCHAKEVEQYSGSKKAYALDNLRENHIYHKFVNAIPSIKEVRDNSLRYVNASENSKMVTCYVCHGSEVTVEGMKEIPSNFGSIKVPSLNNWPNQGVGRINPDGSRGACTSCHPRHSFSIEIARKPYTCSQCHIDQDVPAFEVYKESKHGNIFFSKQDTWNWNSVPWKVGRDFQAPTCATCHNSLLVNPEGKEIVSRTHDFGERLWVRLFGLIYSHPQPKSAKTYEINNKDGLPLPATYMNELAAEYLINEEAQLLRKNEMKKVCNGCHNTDWIIGYFEKLDSTIEETDTMVLNTTNLMKNMWDKGFADASNPFDELIEMLWVKEWFFYANSIRFASAMLGADRATFKNGWWQLTENFYKIHEYARKCGSEN
ncbi:MAG: hydroxylamine oxidase [Candidatus Kuenenia sp.]|nr:hydroxylamine oxidase [Candidatus Kuenenia hertensis]